MTPSLVMVVAIGVLFTTGTYLLLSRSISRALFGLLLMGNGTNLLFLVAGGRAGSPPIVGVGQGTSSDPLPQAMVLTAIVIALGTTAFMLSMAHRAGQLARHDSVEDDPEDVRIHALSRLQDHDLVHGAGALPTHDELFPTHDEQDPGDPESDDLTDLGRASVGPTTHNRAVDRAEP